MGISWGDTIKNFQRRTVQVSIDVEKRTKNIVDLTSRDIKRWAEKETPVDSGKLKSSWRLYKSGLGKKRRVVITNLQDYVVPVEHGTRKTPPRRMLAKAMIKGDRVLKQRMNKLKRRMARKFN